MKYLYLTFLAAQLYANAVSAGLVPRSAVPTNSTTVVYSSTVTQVLVWPAADVVVGPSTTVLEPTDNPSPSVTTTYPPDVDVIDTVLSYTIITTFTQFPCITTLAGDAAVLEYGHSYGENQWTVDSSTTSLLFAPPLSPGQCLALDNVIGTLGYDDSVSTTTSSPLTSVAQITSIPTISPSDPLAYLSSSLPSSCLATDVAFEFSPVWETSSTPCLGTATITRTFTILDVSYGYYPNGGCSPIWPELPISVCATTAFETIEYGGWDGPFTASVFPLGCDQSSTVIIPMGPSSGWNAALSAFPNIIPTPSESCPGYVEPTHAVSTTTTSVSAAPSSPISSTTPVKTTFTTSIPSTASPMSSPKSFAQSTTVVAVSTPSGTQAETSNTAAPVPPTSPVQAPSSHDSPSSSPETSTRSTSVLPASNPAASSASTPATAAPVPPSSPAQQSNPQTPTVQASSEVSTQVQTPIATPATPIYVPPTISDVSSSAATSPELPGSTTSVLATTTTTSGTPLSVQKSSSVPLAGDNGETSTPVSNSAVGSASSTFTVIASQSATVSDMTSTDSSASSQAALPETSAIGTSTVTSTVTSLPTADAGTSTANSSTDQGSSTSLLSSAESSPGTSTTVVVPAQESFTSLPPDVSTSTLSPPDQASLTAQSSSLAASSVPVTSIPLASSSGPASSSVPSSSQGKATAGATVAATSKSTIVTTTSAPKISVTTATSAVATYAGGTEKMSWSGMLVAAMLSIVGLVL